MIDNATQEIVTCPLEVVKRLSEEIPDAMSGLTVTKDGESAYTVDADGGKFTFETPQQAINFILRRFIKWQEETAA